MRLHREHPRRPRREKQDCLSNEGSSRGTNQDNKPKIQKTGQRLTKHAQLSSVLWHRINSVQSRIKSNWVLFPPSQLLPTPPGTHLGRVKLGLQRRSCVNSKQWLHTHMPGHPVLSTIYCCTLKVMKNQKHTELTWYMELQSKSGEPTSSDN